MHTHFLKKDFRFAGWMAVKHRGLQANKELRQLLSPGKSNSFPGKETQNKTNQFSIRSHYCVRSLHMTVLQTLNIDENKLLIYPVWTEEEEKTQA